MSLFVKGFLKIIILANSLLSNQILLYKNLIEKMHSMSKTKK